MKNPEEKLEQLRRSSVLEFEHLKAPIHPTAPLRELPEHSVVPENSTEHDHVDGKVPFGSDGSADAKIDSLSASNKSSGTEKPLFKEPGFGAETTTARAEDVLSPSER
ncbi:hypothetical protein K491DRAFT_715547 [Lophiostoma macrostomum CBS 122681]|uniref:Uncharacterized protein n=1 Tax=Lophiostoma macrostomum CBS 122681 TaxID=1314788 RepID=A0A6A6TBA3_9PLEO|nr:hypothetical protein K491DRAFT_715547 [Lophiostoma macrostomum CBS 122681]